MRATTKEQGFYSQIFKLVLPIVIQNLLSAAVNSADVVMLNYVGQSAISAVSLASNYANVLFMVYYGLGTGATLLCAQYFGKGNMRAIQTVEGIALRFSVIISVVVAGIAFTMPQMMMRLFTDNAELIRIGASYLRVMGVTYLCWGITEIYLAVLRSLGRVTISMAMNMMAFALNVFFNACFIFGLFGFPKLGATGVAIATAMSRVIELIGCVIVSIMSKDIKLDLRYMFIRNKLLFSDFVKLSLPALGNDLSWGRCIFDVFCDPGAFGKRCGSGKLARCRCKKYRNCAMLWCGKCGRYSAWKCYGRRKSGKGEGICIETAEADGCCRSCGRTGCAGYHAVCIEICFFK